MKSTSLTAALTLLLTGTAMAQGSVAISGILDGALRHVDNEGRGAMSSVVSGSNATSRLIVSAKEDLGDGRAVSFWLEHGLALDTGAPTGAFWDRRSTLSLTDRRLGELRLGRDYIPNFNDWVRYDNFAYLGVGGSNNLVTATPLGPIRSTWGSAANNVVRASNAIKYFLPGDLGGVDGHVMLALAEGSAVENTRSVGGRLAWTGTVLSVSAAHTTSHNANTRRSKFKDSLLGGSLQYGSAGRINLAWRRFAQADARQVNLLVAVTQGFGPHEVKAMYTQVDMSGRVGAATIDANDAHQLSLGYVYNFSRRTAFYATASQIRNEGAASFVVPGGPAGLAAGDGSRGVELGLRHRF